MTPRTYSSEENYTVIGLGNPGEKYQRTPHNIGSSLLKRLVDQPLGDFEDFTANKYMRAEISKGSIGSSMLELRIPTVYMNESGEAVRDVQDPSSLLVIHDDIDLPMGTLKISFNRGSGGHNGIRSIEKVLESRTFIRFRIGVCPVDSEGRMRKPSSHNGVSSYLVDRDLTVSEQEKFDQLPKRLYETLQLLAERGLEKTMNNVNTK